MIYKSICFFVIFILFFVVSGCNNRVSDSDIFFKAQLGVLSDANITIYLLEQNGTKTLIKDGINSSTGTTIESIGNFKIDIDLIDNDKFYIIEVSKGKDWDANDDGIIDTNNTTNNGKLRMVAKGEWLLGATDIIRITLASEIHYIYSYKYFKDHNTTILENRLENEVLSSIEKDINGDDLLNHEDILYFNPIVDNSKLYKRHFNNLTQILNSIHENNNSVDTIINPLVAVLNYNTSKQASLKFSQDGQKAYIGDIDVFKVVDVNETSPTYLQTLGSLGSYVTPPLWSRNILTLSKDFSKAYLSSGTTNMMNIIDINESSPNYLTAIHTVYAGTFARHILLSNDEKKAYIADDRQRYRILDLDPISPTYLSIIATGFSFGFPNEVGLSKNESRLYVARASAGLIVSDVNTSSLTYLNILDSLNVPTLSLKISEDGARLYAADENRGLVIVDINESSGTYFEIINQSSISFHGRYITLSKDEKRAFIASRPGGFKVVDIDPGSNTYLGIIANFELASIVDGPEFINISNDEHKIYISGQDGNFHIIDNKIPISPTLIGDNNGTLIFDTGVYD